MTGQSETKHTPGPWTVSPNDDTRVTGTVKGRRYIATIDNVGTPEAPANARLIAAAPELLDALHDAAVAIEALLADPADESRRPHAKYFADKARALIAKASTSPTH